MKHIITIIDGTWMNAANKASFSNYSNVYAINWLLDNNCQDNFEQVVFYSSGLGATGLLQDYTAGAFAEGIDQQIRDAYINICSNFRNNENISDKIYIFGFSRGAVAARALSGIISEFGLLKPINVKYFPKIWEAYTNNKNHIDFQLENAMIQDVKIEFLGLFDTVFGARNKSTAFKSLNFSNFNVSKKVKVTVHLLAMDDRRTSFSPMLFDKYDHKEQHLEQIWMPGVHSDIGGTSQHEFLGKCALITMIDRIQKYTKLKFNSSGLKIATSIDNKDIHVSNERIGLWKYSLVKLRNPDEYFSEQFIHPLAYKIRHRIDTIYGVKCNSYKLGKNFHQSNIPTFIDFHQKINWFK